MSEVKNKYRACMVLAALGDMIGYFNGAYEFNEKENGIVKTAGDYSNFIVFHFISQGGFAAFPKPGMVWSDDTILHEAVAEALIETCDKPDGLVKRMKDKMVQTVDTPDKVTVMRKRFAIGNQTLKALEAILQGKVKVRQPYLGSAGGSGGSMRSMCIGLAFSGYHNRQRLVQAAIDGCRITHNNAIAYLGSLASALFTALAIEGKEPVTWVFELITLLEGGIVDDHIAATSPEDVDAYRRDKALFLQHWKDYVEFRFDDMKFREMRSMIYPSMRTMTYHQRFSGRKKTIYPGAGGDDSVIIAYDALLDAKDNWEKLVVYSMLHAGDSDTTGTIAAAWYGACYGTDRVDPRMLKNFRDADRFKRLGEQLYKCYARE
jgi:ADP-ribosylarginine hydrolase